MQQKGWNIDVFLIFSNYSGSIFLQLKLIIWKHGRMLLIEPNAFRIVQAISQWVSRESAEALISLHWKRNIQWPKNTNLWMLLILCWKRISYLSISAVCVNKEQRARASMCAPGCENTNDASWGAHKFIYSINMFSVQRGAVQMEFRNSHKFYGRVWSFIICKRYHKAGHGNNNDLIWWEINYTSAINNPLRALPSPAPRRCAHREAHCRTTGHNPSHCDMPCILKFYLSFKTKNLKSPSSWKLFFEYSLGDYKKGKGLVVFQLIT